MNTHPLGIDLSLFPIRENLTYVNHAGTSPIPRTAADRLKQFADEVSGHASSVYDQWTLGLNATRASAARLLGCDTAEVAFARSTTAGLNLVALGIDWKPGDVIVAEEKTFPANWIGWRDIAGGRGAELWSWPEHADYKYHLEDLEARLKQGGVRLVAATSANFATGFRQDMEAVGKLCKQYDALLCVDAIQTLGVFPLDVKKCHIDFLAADSHKWLMGPEGAGIFYVAKERLEMIDPALVGWMGRRNFGQYEKMDHPPDPTARRFEEGSPNVAGTLAMGESLRFLLETGIDRIAVHNQSICRVLREGLVDLGWSVATPAAADCSASIIAAHRPGVDSQATASAMWKEGKVWAAARRGFLRISPHVYQTEDDMRHILETVKKVMQGGYGGSV